MAYIVRVQHREPSQEPGHLALPAVDRALGQPIEISSVGPADGLTVLIDGGSEVDEGEMPLFNLSVERDGVEIESYDDVSLSDVEGVVNGGSETVQVSVSLDTSSLEDPRFGSS